MNLVFTPEGWEDFEYWMDNDQEAERKNKSFIERNHKNSISWTGKARIFKTWSEGVLVQTDHGRTSPCLHRFWK
jgi:Txe/YoeB family toxin of Txe-Axe toxin-antitoxin module